MIPLMIVGEAWGAEEERYRRPFIGPSGRLLKAMLRQSGVPPTYSMTNVFNLRPAPSDSVLNFCGPKAEGIPGRPFLKPGKYVRACYTPELDRLSAELTTARPNLILAVGGTACWALLGSAAITNLRGTLHPSPWGKVLPTFHPAAVIRQWDLRPIVLADLARAAREALSPTLHRPRRSIWVRPTLADLHEFQALYLSEPATIACDIETEHGFITEVGLSPHPYVALVLPFWSRTGGNYWPTSGQERQAWTWLKAILEDPRHSIGGQNFLYDIQWLYRQMGIRVPGRWDTMLAHHAAEPELPKRLSFLASIYTDEPYWKSLRKRAKDKTEKQED